MNLKDQIPNLEVEGKWINNVVTTDEILSSKKPTLIHFWALSCDICKDNIPIINNLSDTFKDQLNIIGIHSPRDSKDKILGDVEEAASNLNMNHPVFMDYKLMMKENFAANYAPAYYLFDGNGGLRFIQFGSKIKMLHNRINLLLTVQ